MRGGFDGSIGLLAKAENLTPVFASFSRRRKMVPPLRNSSSFNREMFYARSHSLPFEKILR